MFLTFEGIDGCGKTTQLRLLRKRLEQAGHAVLCTREPGGTALAEAIRAHLLNTASPLCSQSELLLFGAARAQHVAEVIEPALQRGDIVLCDRFTDSSLAYQGGGLGLDRAFIEAMNRFATGEVRPSLTFYLDIDPEIGASRRRRDAHVDRIEQRGLEFQSRVRAAYLELARSQPERIVTLDGSPAVEVVHQELWRHFEARFRLISDEFKNKK